MKEHSGRLISILYRKSQAYLNQALKQYGIAAGEYPIILYLCEKDGVTQEELAVYYGMDKSAITRVIQSLQEKSLLERAKDQNDKRCNRIFITKKGRASEKDIRQTLDRWNEIMTKGLTEEEVEELNRVLKFMVKNCL